MPCIPIKIGKDSSVLCFNPEYRIEDRSGKVWRFEFHKYCGPTVLGRDGDPVKNQPPEKSLFWDAITQWIKQGEKTVKGKGGTWAEWKLDDRRKKKNRKK